MSVMAIVPSATQAKIAAIAEAAELPDVSGMQKIDSIDPSNLVSLVVALEAQLDAATEAFEAACAPIMAAVAEARKLVKGAIIDNGGKALAHDTFDVVLETTTRPDKRIDVLRHLEGVLPDDLYRQAVYIKSLEVSHADAKAVETAIEGGAKPTWDANLTKLNKYARDFGGEIARIVEEGSPRVEVGEAKLVIRPRESALKIVS